MAHLPAADRNRRSRYGRVVKPNRRLFPELWEETDAMETSPTPQVNKTNENSHYEEELKRFKALHRAAFPPPPTAAELEEQRLKQIEMDKLNAIGNERYEALWARADWDNFEHIPSLDQMLQCYDDLDRS
jgi:hypothetical protein